jgi:hypothetical protein
MALEGGGNWPPADLAARMLAGMDEAAHLLGEQLVRQAQVGILTGPKSGRHYPALRNQSSAPGEYSANQSGDLLRSIDFSVSGETISFHATSDHAGFQEFGTSRMAPRPNLEMSIEDSDGIIREIIEQAMWRAFGGG